MLNLKIEVICHKPVPHKKVKDTIGLSKNSLKQKTPQKKRKCVA